MQVFWAMLIVATGAAIVASQALISASYQIVSQVQTPLRSTIVHSNADHLQCYSAVHLVSRGSLASSL